MLRGEDNKCRGILITFQIIVYLNKFSTYFFSKLLVTSHNSLNWDQCYFRQRQWVSTAIMAAWTFHLWDWALNIKWKIFKFVFIILVTHPHPHPRPLSEMELKVTPYKTRRLAVDWRWPLQVSCFIWYFIWYFDHKETGPWFIWSLIGGRSVFQK